MTFWQTFHSTFPHRIKETSTEVVHVYKVSLLAVKWSSEQCTMTRTAGCWESVHSAVLCWWRTNTMGQFLVSELSRSQFWAWNYTGTGNSSTTAQVLATLSLQKRWRWLSVQPFAICKIIYRQWSTSNQSINSGSRMIVLLVLTRIAHTYVLGT